MARDRALSVVVLPDRDSDLIAIDLAHQTVLIGDPCGPVASKVLPEGFGRTDLRVAVALEVGHAC